ncbi:hypothetical protein KBB96_04265 [Luteolibacter ambystomatis]|uniref:Alpha/beta hydrolase n=1 Tax=Luteolibacter ambystomatis TaxID=2824561 RepID=A0A975J148_9BACT|nr:hypothetical protein [Luteolibacter ambystomatis]QUE52108.1 hypothetical protein KBB96_04265 [Luteolibacter ambystomatis]
MSTITTKDETSIYYKDWGSGQPIVYPGAPHGITDTHKDQLNADPLAFIQA